MSTSIKSNYRDNEQLRSSFNALAKNIFGLDFEGWYQNGFWKDNYNPYSVVIDGEVVSNVSVNICDINYKGRVIRLLQLGTVMTDPDHRGNGYSRMLMEKIMEDYEDKVGGIYLFANDSVKGFYPRFGFREGREYQYSKEVSILLERNVVPVPMRDQKDWLKMVQILNEREQNSAMYMVGNSGLYMFYLSQFMQENVYHLPEQDTYVIAEEEGDMLILHAIIGEADIETVIAAFGGSVKKVILCFTPKDADGFIRQELHEEDTTLFVKGRFFDEYDAEKYMFQAITHA